MSHRRNILFMLSVMLISACRPEFNAPCSIEINGMEALKEGHLFQGKDSLVVISSKGGMDVITVIKGDGKQEYMIITVINPTDSALEISSLKVLSTTGKGENSVWRWQNSGTANSPEVSLQLSESSIVLLPEERITLPPLQFFSHLCSD